MRSLTLVVVLAFLSALFLPACHEDWSVLGHELEVTADELGAALGRWDGGAVHTAPSEVTADVRRLAERVEAWAAAIEHDLGAWAASVESGAEELGRRLEASVSRMGHGMELSLEPLGRAIEGSVERLGRVLERALADLSCWLSTLG